MKKKFAFVVLVIMAVLTIGCEPESNKKPNKKVAAINFNEGFPKIESVSDTTTLFSFSLTDDAAVYSMIIETADKKPDGDQIVTGKFSDDTWFKTANITALKHIKKSLSYDSLKPETSYTILIVAVNKNNRYSEIKELSITTEKSEDNNDNPGDNTGDEPGDNPGDNTGDEPGDNPGDNTGDEPGDNPGDNTGDEPGDEEPVVVIDESSLIALVSDVKKFLEGCTAGYEYGNYPLAEMTKLQGILDTKIPDGVEKTQALVDEMHKTLLEAFNSFKLTQIKTPNKTPLNNEITEVENILKNAVIGELNGNYPQSAKTAIDKVISDAKIIAADKVSTQARVDEMVDDLKKAKEDFLKSRIVINIDSKELEALITDVENFLETAVEGTNYGNYPAGSKQVVRDEITKAKAVITKNDATQADVDKAFKDLSEAYTVFKLKEIEASDKTALEREIDNVKDILSKAVVGSESGNYPQAAVDALTTVLNAAKTVFNDTSSNQSTVNTHVENLKSAAVTFGTKMISYTSIKNNMYVRGSFTGEMWSAQPMKLLGNNTWKHSQTLTTGSHSFKLTDNTTWTGQVFGRVNGVPAWANDPINIIINVASTQTVTLTFNDSTNTLSIEGAVMASGNPKTLWFSGDFGDPAVNDGFISYKMSETSADIWETIIQLHPGEYDAAFTEGEMFAGRIWAAKKGASWSNGSIAIEERDEATDNKFKFTAGASIQSFYTVTANYKTQVLTITAFTPVDKYIVGTFNNWTFDKMSYTSGSYTAVKDMLKGVYRLKLSHTANWAGETFGAAVSGSSKTMSWGQLTEDLYFVLGSDTSVTFTYNDNTKSLTASAGTIYSSPYSFAEPETMYINIEGKASPVVMAKQQDGRWKGIVNIVKDELIRFKFIEGAIDDKRVFGTNPDGSLNNADGSDFIRFTATSAGNHSIYFNFSAKSYSVH